MAKKAHAEHVRSVLLDRQIDTRFDNLCDTHFAQGTQSPLLKIDLDGMDQAKFKVPRIHTRFSCPSPTPDLLNHSWPLRPSPFLVSVHLSLSVSVLCSLSLVLSLSLSVPLHRSVNPAFYMFSIPLSPTLSLSLSLSQLLPRSPAFSRGL
eukprot:13121073-Alexandrium_andersonii.AAC.1